MTSTLTTTSCTTPLFYTPPAFPIDVMANLNHTTLPLKDNLTVASGDIIPMVSKFEDEASSSAGTNTSSPSISAMEKSNVTTRNEYLKPSFFYQQPLRIACLRAKGKPGLLFDKQMRSIQDGQLTYSNFGTSERMFRRGIQPFKIQHEMFVKRTRGHPNWERPDKHLRDYLQRRRRLDCLADNGCICDQDTGKIIPPPNPGQDSHCRDRFIAAACAFILGCYCSTTLRKPVLTDIDFPVVADDFKHAINEIPASVLLSPENSDWFWTVPPEITDGEEVTITPGDPVPPRINIASAGEPPLWLYGPPINPPGLRPSLPLADDELGIDAGPSSQSEFRVDPGWLPGPFPYYPSKNFEYDDRYQY
ncbi:hypothetical protein TWF173_003598 [Orbilia oligospora]|nr:hypothetical protein TWF173_003598 [Orbilia oligospora]